jgi:hypothetical protein
MTRPDDLFEAASYDLNKFRERRMTERRLTPRNTADRRGQQVGQGGPQEQQNVGTPPESQPE